MPDHRDHVEWLRLILTPGLGPASSLALLRAFGSPSAVITQSRTNLATQLKPTLVDAVLAGPDAATLDAHLEWLTHPGRHLLTLADPDYPARLLESPCPPVALFVMGQRELLCAPSLAIVGSRHATAGGKDTARQFARAFSDQGLVVVSGLAAGIDGAAHDGGLAGKASTIAVIGTGLDRVYPAAHRDLAHRIAAEGAIISEYPLGSPPIAGHFPQRNRIIAGLSLGCLVVEATLDSGSLITAKDALEMGRDMFAIPGSIHAPQSKGCHRLIKDGAKLVEAAEDVLAELPGDWRRARPLQAELTAAPSPEQTAPAEEDPLLTALGYDPIDLDTLQLRTGDAMGALSARLLELELTGLVEVLPGARYQRRR